MNSDFEIREIPEYKLSILLIDIQIQILKSKTKHITYCINI